MSTPPLPSPALRVAAGAATALRRGRTAALRWVVAAALAIACGLAAARGGPAPPSWFDPAPLHTELPESVAEAMRRADLPIDSLGFYAQAVKGPRALLALNAERPFVLASATKVVVTLAALDLLGPAYRWHTQARLDGPLVDGRLDGDLVIVGGGNASLDAEELGVWFARLQSLGLREIAGNIVIDRMAFRLSDSDHAHTPRPAPQRPHHAWPSALQINDGVLRVRIEAARGHKAVLSLMPQLADVVLSNEVAAGRRCETQPHWDQTSDSLVLRVTGSWAAWCGVRTIAVAMLSEADLTGRAMAALWKAQGGVLRGRVVDRTPVDAPAARRGGDRTPDDAAAPAAVGPAFALHSSPALQHHVRQINKSSDNLAARHLFLSLSPGFPKEAATLAGARQRLRQWLRQRGLGEDDIEIDNGSGLSRTERGKPRAMVALLRKAWADRRAQVFVESLPIAGVDGTLAQRFRDSPATGRAQLKTGTLTDARTLAGYVRANSGTVYAVAAMVNHPRAEAGAQALDSLIEWLVIKG